MTTPDLFDAQPAPEVLTPTLTPEEKKPAAAEIAPGIPDTLPPLPAFGTHAEALAAIIAAFDRKPNYFKGFAVLSSELSDAIEGAKALMHTSRAKELAPDDLTP